MTNSQFVLWAFISILIVLSALGVERYRDCMQFGGDYCRLGPYVGFANSAGGLGIRGR